VVRFFALLKADRCAVCASSWAFPAGRALVLVLDADVTLHYLDRGKRRMSVVDRL
jgi:hypothetical protein